MKNPFFAGLALVIAIIPNITLSAERDEDRFVRLTKYLEQQPLMDVDKSARGWLFKWAVESETVSVTECGVLGITEEDKFPYKGEIMIQPMLGNAAFQIQHPDKKNDFVATQLAGIRSALAAYSSILSSQPNVQHSKHLDDLLRMDTEGALGEYVTRTAAEKCKE